LAPRLQTPRNGAKWQTLHPSQADTHETPIRNTQPAASKLPADRSESLVLMLLIQMCLRWPTWLLPAASGIESSAPRATIAQPAINKIAAQHRIWLAPIHAPPPRLSSWADAQEACSRLPRQWQHPGPSGNSLVSRASSVHRWPSWAG